MVYVGLTYYLKRRYRDHLKTRRFKDIAQEYGFESIYVEQLTD